jgi:uncharacterized surface protein with fasciclin (FAS1) repeats
MNKPLRLLALSLAAALTLGLGACATAPAPAPLPDTLARDTSLSTFNRLVADAGLQDTLRGAGPLTVFVPNDEAFKAVPAKTLEALAKDKEQLKAVLTYHIVGSKLAAADIQNGTAKSLQGATLTTSRTGAFVGVEDALVLQADINATNGVAHVIDRVLMPPKK